MLRMMASRLQNLRGAHSASGTSSSEERTTIHGWIAPFPHRIEFIVTRPARVPAADASRRASPAASAPPISLTSNRKSCGTHKEPNNGRVVVSSRESGGAGERGASSPS